MQEVSFYLRTLTCLCTDVPLFGSVLTDLRETLTGLNRVTCAGLWSTLCSLNRFESVLIKHIKVMWSGLMQISAGVMTTDNTSVFCHAERSHAPDPVHDPALIPVDSVEDHFLMDAGSYDEVGVAQRWCQCFSCFLFWSTSLLFLGLVSSAAAAGSGHALASPLHTPPAVLSGLPAALLRPLWHLLLPLLQRHLLLPPSRPHLPAQTHLTTHLMMHLTTLSRNMLMHDAVVHVGWNLLFV